MSSPAADALNLPLTDPQAREVLDTGLYRDVAGREHVALLRDFAPPYVSFRLELAAAFTRPGAAVRWFTAIRAISLTATFTPCLATLLLGYAQGRVPNLPVAAAAALGALLFQIAINVLNDVEDHHRGIDLPGQHGGSGVIQRGWVSARDMRRLGWAALALGVLCGVPALVREPRLILAIGALGVVGTLGYSGRALALKYRALGDLAVLVLCGPAITAGFAVAAFGAVDAGTLWLGLATGFAAVGILHANNLQDIPIDTARGSVTFASWLGFARARHWFAAVYIAAYGSLLAGAALGHLPWASLAAALTLPPVIALVRSIYAASGPFSPQLQGARFRSAQLHLGMGLLTCAGLLAATLLNGGAS